MVDDTTNIADTAEADSSRKEKLVFGIALAASFAVIIALYSLMLLSPYPGGRLPSLLPKPPEQSAVVDPDDEQPRDPVDPNKDDDQQSPEMTGNNGTEDPSTPELGGNGNSQGSPSTGNNNQGSGGNNNQATQPTTDPHAGQTWHEPWDEQVLVSGAWDEQVLVSAAWDETIHHDAVYNNVHHDEVGHWGARCNQCGMNITGFANQHLHDSKPCYSYTNMYWFVDSPAWDEQVLVSGAWDETVHHNAVYNTVHHNAVYSTIHHEGWWEDK